MKISPVASSLPQGVGGGGKGAGREAWNRLYMIASVKKFGRVRLSTNFLQNKYGGEGRHGTAPNTFF